MYEFEKPIRVGFSNKKEEVQEIKPKRKESKRNREYRKRTAQKAKNRIKLLALCNFSKRSKFITLTFNNDCRHNIRDINECNKEFKKYIQRLRYRYGSFKYIVVPQFQDKNRKGVIHYHLLSNLPYIPQKKLMKLWGHGFVDVHCIDKVDNIGAYITKYMVKNAQDKRLKKQKCYSTSKGLNKPKVIYDAYHLIQELMLNKRKPNFRNEYQSEYNGLIKYKEFNDNRDVNFYDKEHDD